MEFTIKSKKLNRDITFFCSGDSGYIYVNLNGQHGTLGNQICKGGSLSGNTLYHSYSGDNDKQNLARFGIVCRAWWRSYLRHQNLYNTCVIFDDML